jgi:hypothetical protein
MKIPLNNFTIFLPILVEVNIEITLNRNKSKKDLIPQVYKSKLDSKIEVPRPSKDGPRENN